MPRAGQEWEPQGWAWSPRSGASEGLPYTRRAVPLQTIHGLAIAPASLLLSPGRGTRAGRATAVLALANVADAVVVSETTVIAT